MSKRVTGFTVMAAACVVCALLPASRAYADEIFLTDGSDMLYESDDYLEDELTDDCLLEEDYQVGFEEELLPDDEFIEDEILIEDPGDDDILIEDPSSGGKKGGSGGGSGSGTEPVKPANPPASVSDVQKVLNNVNAIRARSGAKALSFRSDLNYVAGIRVNELTRKFSHTRPNGKSGASILIEYGVDYNACGENIACYATADDVAAAWASSPSHNKCMTNRSYGHAGIATVTVGGCQYWVLILTD